MCCVHALEWKFKNPDHIGTLQQTRIKKNCAYRCVLLRHQQMPILISVLELENSFCRCCSLGINQSEMIVRSMCKKAASVHLSWRWSVQWNIPCEIHLCAVKAFLQILFVFLSISGITLIMNKFVLKCTSILTPESCYFDF